MRGMEKMAVFNKEVIWMEGTRKVSKNISKTQEKYAHYYTFCKVTLMKVGIQFRDKVGIA